MKKIFNDEQIKYILKKLGPMGRYTRKKIRNINCIIVDKTQ